MDPRTCEVNGDAWLQDPCAEEAGQCHHQEQEVATAADPEAVESEADHWRAAREHADQACELGLQSWPEPADEKWRGSDERVAELIHTEPAVVEAWEREKRHLGIDYPKTCVTLILDGNVQPLVGLRSKTAWALAAEMCRAGCSEEQVAQRLHHWWQHQLDQAVREAPGRDGRPFTQAEVGTAVRSAFRPQEPKTPGCNHEVWREACVGTER